MTAAAVTLSAPAPEATVELAEAALAAHRRVPEDRSVDLDALAWCAGEPVADEPRRWAERIATPDGFPLIGTGLSAPTYPALLWNGARLHAVAPDVAPDAGWPALLAALAAAGAGAADDAGNPGNVVDPGGAGDAQGLDRVFRALAAADAVRRGAALLLSAATPPVAWPTVSTMAAATAALLAGPRAADDLVRVLDVSASLMVLTPGDAHSAVAGLWAGHSAASGWLAARLADDAVSPMGGSVVHTLSAAAGRGVGRAPEGERGWGSVADVLARLR